jgi:hypothetical protein
MQTFYFYTDPGHGWLEVPRELLQDLGIADRATYCTKCTPTRSPRAPS